jgi:hypothetical protein
MRIPRVLPSQFLWAIVFLATGTPLAANNPQEVPVADGGLGSCRADFTVKDEAGKPIYNAKIDVTLKSGGLFSRKKTELEVGTNSDGKARVIGLPALPKKPLEFQIKSGTVSKALTDDPSATCNAVYDVVLSAH